MPGNKFTEKITIICSRDTAFFYSQDYSNRLKWDTFLIKARLLDGATAAGVGVRADCTSKNGLNMVTEYVSFNPPNNTAVKMTKGPFIFKEFAGSWKFEEMEKGTTEVSFIYSFKLRWIFKMFRKPMKRKLQKEVKQRLIDLKKNIEAEFNKTDIK